MMQYESPSEFPLGNGVAWATKKRSFSTFFFLEKSDFEVFFGRVLVRVCFPFPLTFSSIHLTKTLRPSSSDNFHHLIFKKNIHHVESD